MEEAGRHDLGGVAEDTGLVWLGEKEAEGQPHYALQIPEVEVERKVLFCSPCGTQC